MSQRYIKEATYKFSSPYLPGKCSISHVYSEHHLGVLEDAGSSWQESWCFWHGECTKGTSRKLHIKFQVSTILESAPSPMCLQSVIMESKRTLVVPDRSVGGFWHGGCPKVTSKKLHINFQVCTFLGSTPYTMCPQIIIMESKRTLKVPERSLDGFWHESDNSYRLNIAGNQRSYSACMFIIQKSKQYVSRNTTACKIVKRVLA